MRANCLAVGRDIERRLSGKVIRGNASVFLRVFGRSLKAAADVLAFLIVSKCLIADRFDNLCNSNQAI